jgi:type II secretory pathway pseudopilin PulG
MPIGERSASRRHTPHRPTRRAPPRRGFTWLLLLFGLAIAGAGLARLGTQWQQAAQREREAELLFRGLQLRDALLRFQAQTPTGQPALPHTLDELLSDRRRPEPRHHLRRLWTDPFTGAADWVLLRAADGGIVGLHSRATRPLLRRAGLPAGVTVDLAASPASPNSPTTPPPERAPLARDWQFAIQPAAPVPVSPPLADAGSAKRAPSP